MAVCLACGHEIAEAARLCPFCGSDPRSKQSPPRPEPARQAHPLRLLRQRHELLIALGVLLLILLLAGFDQWIARRNPPGAVPLTEVSDFGSEAPLPLPPMPELQYRYDGNPQAARRMIVEPQPQRP